MPPGPDLFVVCKQCGSEVSPYITECPYCGARLRRRAPKLPRMNSRGQRFSRGLRRLRVFGGGSSGSSGGGGGGSGGGGRTPSQAGARRQTADPWAAGDQLERERRERDRPSSRRRARAYGGGLGSRPYATIALVAAGCAGWVAVRGGYVAWDKLAIVGPLHGDWWKLFSCPFAYIDGLYAFVALLATALFGWLLERRHGPALVLAVFFGGAVTGALAAGAVYAEPIVSGANGGALALLGAWSVPDLRAAGRGAYYEGDLLGVCAIAAVLLLTPYARPEASWLAGVVGLAVGLVLGAGTLLIDPVQE